MQFEIKAGKQLQGEAYYYKKKFSISKLHKPTCVWTHAQTYTLINQQIAVEALLPNNSTQMWFPHLFSCVNEKSR